MINSTSYVPPLPSSPSSGSPPPVTTWSIQQKRKSSDNNDKDENDRSPLEKRGYHRQHHALVKKTAHNMIEKHYRTNLNDKIAALRNCVPSLKITSSAKVENVKKGEEDATVLSKVAKYILHLEKHNKALCKENAMYKGHIESFEILMLTTKNSNTTITTTANTPPMSATSTSTSRSSHPASGSFDSKTSTPSLSECGINKVKNREGTEAEVKKMSEEEEVLKNELDTATAN
ncbi:hypothetical protein F5884DRAFT_862525 [Xylogone sp. PMI_703]|nr:hypothetical protein F5884DRAFT_862525 [Xylogone sp. PMI_703]